MNSPSRPVTSSTKPRSSTACSPRGTPSTDCWPGCPTTRGRRRRRCRAGACTTSSRTSSAPSRCCSGVPTRSPTSTSRRSTHVRNAIGAMNECWVRHLSGETRGRRARALPGVTAERREVLTGDDRRRLERRRRSTPAGPDSYGRFMRIRIFDCWMHEQDIREALARPSSDAELDGPAARLRSTRWPRSMGFVVGKLGKAPDGSRVALELTGPLARTHPGGGRRPGCGGRRLRRRGADGDDPAGRPAVHPAVRRAADGAARSTAIEIEGDTEVGQRDRRAT